MIRASRRNLREAGLRADVRIGDMRSLRVGRTFDALLCLGTAFNYLASSPDVRRGLRTFRRHLRPGGLLVLDTTNFDPWIEHPTNIRAELDHHMPNGTRLAVFSLNDQDRARSLHVARFITAVQRGRNIDLAFDEARLRIWTRKTLSDALRREGFRPIEWWGDLKIGATYDRLRSPRLVAVAQRTKRPEDVRRPRRGPDTPSHMEGSRSRRRPQTTGSRWIRRGSSRAHRSPSGRPRAGRWNPGRTDDPAGSP